MKKICYVLTALLTLVLFSCSSDNDKNEEARSFSCMARYSTVLTFRSHCQFFFFPKGNYVKVERSCSNYEETLPWNAYAVTASGERVASVMQANYEETDEWAKPYAVNGYKGSTTEGTFYVVAIPYRFNPERYNGYWMGKCYKAKEITKKSSEYGGILVTFKASEYLDDYFSFEGVNSELVNLGSW